MLVPRPEAGQRLGGVRLPTVKDNIRLWTGTQLGRPETTNAVPKRVWSDDPGDVTTPAQDGCDVSRILMSPWDLPDLGPRQVRPISICSDVFTLPIRCLANDSISAGSTVAPRQLGRLRRA